MTRLILIDTETNGLPKSRYAPVTEPGAWPSILQLSWAIYNLEGSVLSLESSRDIGLALDPAEPWNAGAAAIHGISEREARSGESVEKALAAFQAALKSADYVIAHNLSFDRSVLRAAGYKVGLRDLWPAKMKELCTMKATRDLLKLPASAKQAQYSDLSPYKAPRLDELYTWLYGSVYDVSGAVLHTAVADVDCLARCLSALLGRGLLTLSPSSE